MNTRDNHTIEMLRLSAPGELIHHRETELDEAFTYLTRSLEAAGLNLNTQPVVPQSPEVNLYAQAQSDKVEAERLSRESAVNDMTVERLSRSVDAIYEGQGNPLYDQETI